MTQTLEQKICTGGLGNTNIVPMNPPQKSRNWFFTLNNHTKKEVDTIYDEIFKLNCMKFIFQEEKGKDGTKHLQGTIAYKNAVSFNTMKRLSPRAHWEKVKNLKNAMAYCCKEETRYGKVYRYNYEIPKSKEEMWNEFIEINMPTGEEIKKMNCILDIKYYK